MTDLIEQVARAIYDAEIKGLEGFDLAVMESAYYEGSIEHEMACDAAKAAVAAVHEAGYTIVQRPVDGWRRNVPLSEVLAECESSEHRTGAPPIPPLDDNEQEPRKPEPDWGRKGTQPQGMLGDPPPPNGKPVAMKPTKP